MNPSTWRSPRTRRWTGTVVMRGGGVLWTGRRIVRSQDRPDGLSATERQGAALEVVDLGAGLVPQAVQDGRGQVLRLDPALAGLAALPVGRPVDVPAADAAAGQDDGEDRPPVVPPAGGVHPGRAA